ncbi:MAG TPA: DUF2127 domain-containing protein [Steroidobacteraceae bacterium]
MASPNQAPARRIDGLRVIAIFKYIKAVLLILTSYGVHRLLDPALLEKLRLWSATLTDRVDQRLLLRALSWVQGLGEDKLHLVIAVTVAYTAVVLIEGTGLWLRRRWAEWVTIVATLSLIPFELWELFMRPPGRRLTVVATLLVNVLIAAYLGYLLRTAHLHQHPGPAA